MSSGGGLRRVVQYAMAYALPAAAVWGGLAVALHSLQAPSALVLAGASLYAFAFGVIETVGLRVSSPSIGWQVPLSWVRAPKIDRMLVWGSLLGPGLFTRNPYAGVWLLPAAVVIQPSLIGAVSLGLGIGLAHGTTRALGVLRNAREPTSGTLALLVLARTQLRWRILDGAILLLASGAVTAHLMLALNGRTWL